MLNYSCYFGHSAVRLYVMGDAAYERAAEPEEIARDVRARAWRGSGPARPASRASFSYAHRGVDGKPVPSRFAERDEVEALYLAAGATGKGVVLATPGEQCTYADFYELQEKVGRPFFFPLFALPDGRHLEHLGAATRAGWPGDSTCGRRSRPVR